MQRHLIKSSSRKKLINCLSELLQNLRLKTETLRLNLTSAVHEKLTATFKELLGEYKKLLSSELSVNYTQLENDSTSTIRSKFSQINASWRVQDIWRSVYVDAIIKFNNEASILNTGGIPLLDAGSWLWDNEASFSQSIIGKTDLIVKYVLGNAIGRPAFAAFRPGALAEFIKKQKDICLAQWGAGMKATFQQEQNNIESSLKRKTDTLLAPVEKYLASLETEVSQQQGKLIQLQNIQHSAKMSVMNTQAELQKLALFFNE